HRPDRRRLGRRRSPRRPRRQGRRLQRPGVRVRRRAWCGGRHDARGHHGARRAGCSRPHPDDAARRAGGRRGDADAADSDATRASPPERCPLGRPDRRAARRDAAAGLARSAPALTPPRRAPGTVALCAPLPPAPRGPPPCRPPVPGPPTFRRAAPATPETLSVSLEMVGMFTWIHVLIFAALGGVASRLLAMVERNPSWGFG